LESVATPSPHPPKGSLKYETTYQPIESIPPADSDAWTVADGEYDGRPTLLRFRPNLAHVLGHPALPRRLVVTWTFDQDDWSGLPNSEQSKDLEWFEDCLTSALDPGRAAVLAFVFTHAGVREWHYYFSDSNIVQSRIDLALGRVVGLPVVFAAVSFGTSTRRPARASSTTPLTGDWDERGRSCRESPRVFATSRLDAPKIATKEQERPECLLMARSPGPLNSPMVCASARHGAAVVGGAHSGDRRDLRHYLARE
jgi:hypothetical protein